MPPPNRLGYNESFPPLPNRDHFESRELLNRANPHFIVMVIIASTTQYYVLFIHQTHTNRLCFIPSPWRLPKPPTQECAAAERARRHRAICINYLFNGVFVFRALKTVGIRHQISRVIANSLFFFCVFFLSSATVARLCSHLPSQFMAIS